MTPVLLVQAATQAPRVVQRPVSPSDRRELHDLMGTLTATCAMNLELYELGDLAAVLGACARAHYVPEQLLLPLQIRLQATARSKQSEDTPAHVAALAGHLSRLRVKAPCLWQAVGGAGLASLDLAGPGELAGLLGAHARAGVANPQLFERAVARAAGRLATASPEHVARLMWALARSNHGCSRTWVRAVASHLAAHAANYGVAQLATLAGAAAKLGVDDVELRRVLAGRGAEALQEEASALAATAALPPAAWPSGLPASLGGAGHWPQQPVTSQAVAVLVSGLAAMGADSPDLELLRAAGALLAAMADSAAAGGPGRLGGGGFGGVGRVERVHVEQVGAAMRQAGLQEESEFLMQQVRADGQSQSWPDGSTVVVARGQANEPRPATAGRRTPRSVPRLTL